MHIMVCVKQVPWMTAVKTDSETGRLIRDGIASTINPFDLHAIEEALRIKEERGGSVTVLSMGPPQAQHALRTALAMGGDRGVLLSDRDFSGADTLATSYTLAQGIKKVGNADLILCGIKTTDGDTAQVGPGIAEELDVPHACYIKKIVKIGNEVIIVEQEMDDGYRVLEIDLPCVLTLVKDINTPRMPTLEGKLATASKQLVVYTKQDLEGDDKRFGINGSPTQVRKVFEPSHKKSGKMLSGPPKNAVRTLYQILTGMKA